MPRPQLPRPPQLHFPILDLIFIWQSSRKEYLFYSHSIGSEILPLENVIANNAYLFQLKVQKITDWTYEKLKKSDLTHKDSFLLQTIMSGHQSWFSCLGIFFFWKRVICDLPIGSKDGCCCVVGYIHYSLSPQRPWKHKIMDDTFLNQNTVVLALCHESS